MAFALALQLIGQSVLLVAPLLRRCCCCCFRTTVMQAGVR